MQDSHPLGIFIVCDEGLDARLSSAQKLGIPTAQILAPSAENRTTTQANILAEKFNAANIHITVVFCGFAGESYADIPTVKNTVGLVPAATRMQRFAEAKEIADFAKFLNVPAVGMHIGFIPENTDVADYTELVELAQNFCDYCVKHEQRVHLETGQETAEILLQFLKDVNRANLAVNFDPANMILYGSGEPLAALTQVGAFVKSVHCKDAIWSEQPRLTWGTETPLGKGDVNMPQFLATLQKIGYSGPLTIEREINGAEQLQDIAAAVELLTQIKKDLGFK